MDTYAAGLRVAYRLVEDEVLDQFINNRYQSFNSGIGASIESGNENLASLEQYVLDRPQSQLIEATESGHLEQIKDTLNHYIVDTLRK